MFSTAKGAIKLSLIVIVTLVALKLVAAVITGGISIIAQVVDSLLDVIAITVTLFAVKVEEASYDS